MFRTILFTALVLAPIAIGLTVVNLGNQDWRTASREPVGLAPDPQTSPDAVVQVYAARAFDWRGLVGVHSWIATKETGADAYTVYEVSGWRLRRSGTSVSASDRSPDARWFGNAPELRVDLPPTAIGKDFLGGRLVAAAPSGTGVQFSLGGLAGILVAIEEGLEINLLGATFGIDPLDLSLKAPFVGRIGTLVSGLLLAAAVGIWVLAFRR